MKQIPNVLTALRLVLSLGVFASLIAIAAGERGSPIPGEVGVVLCWFSVIGFVVAGVTDFLDGWLARRMDATSLFGTILDPIADKILICGAIVGLIAMGMPSVFPRVGMPVIFAAFGGLMLFREFAVSALREVLAPRGIRLPVTFFAKSKTTLQIVALTAIMILALWPVWGIDIPGERLLQAWFWAAMLLAAATAVTVWTGVRYLRDAIAALRGAEKKPLQ